MADSNARIRALIMGAAGRDFHNFNVLFRGDPRYEIVAFTAAQIPNIEGRTYPPELAGPLYPAGIPIHPEESLEALIDRRRIDEVIFSYSDVSHEEVMHRASRAVARGASFRLLSSTATMLGSGKPVVSVCAVRTGCGKSPVSRRVAALLKSGGRRVAIVRHPMPYGDLLRQAVQRFASLEDLDRARCTIEEREEYEPHLQRGSVVFAGVDYEKILRKAEAEADVILWDGGNNDTPMIAPDLEIVLVDPHRAGHERTYYPGEVNLLRADVVVITKEDTADLDRINAVRDSVHACNPRAVIIDAAMPVRVDDPDLIRGRRALVIEDGPTLTHGGMAYGAGVIAARKYGASLLVDPLPGAVGSIRKALEQNSRAARLLPALGYSREQLRELEETIANAHCDVVVMATPIDLRRIIAVRQPACRVTYEVQEIGEPTLRDVLKEFVVGSVAHAE